MSEADRSEEAVFEAALPLRTTERAAYLDQACAGDPWLRQRVESLLGALERGGGRLCEPAVARSEASGVHSLPPAAKPGDRIGRYKLLQRIGEGGCGVVYMAEQEEPMRRRVALKVIKLGMDTQSVIARFEAERQALALMDHPNIAKVLDAGATETGRPYFVMELVRGVKITDFCDENQLPIKQRLQLFIQVCQAIQHAHQKGIIHRDIKPSNILVTVNDGVPVPKVIDFGIAKATSGQPLTDKTLFTAFEQFIGTPAYMSPEQAVLTSLDIDTRSDIYSLGVLLYELLTGKTPFDAKELLGSGMDAMRKTLREQEPPKPSTRLTQELVAADVSPLKSPHGIERDVRADSLRLLQMKELIHLVRGDLDWIVMKALEKDRTRRYETANGLARDIERHLNCEPVAARPPSRLYEFQKTVRRHKFGFAAGAAVILALAVGVLVSTWQAFRATRAEVVAKVSVAQLKQADRVRTEEMYRSYLDQIHAKRQSGVAGHRQAGLDLIAKAVAIRPSLELRNEAIATLATMDVRLGRTWHLTNSADYMPWQFDRAFQRYALVDGTNGIRIRRESDDAEVAMLRHPSRTVERLFGVEGLSPDGRYLAASFKGEKHWVVWEISSARLVLDNPHCEHGVTFSRDGTRFAASQPDGNIRLYDLSSGAEVASVKAGRPLDYLRLNPEADRVLGCVVGETEVGIWDFATGKAQVFPAPDRLNSADWGTGDLIAAGSATGRIYLWNARTGQLRQIIEAHDHEVQQVTFNHRGDLLASSSWDGTTRFSNPWAGKVELTFPRNAQSLLFSRDDQQFSLVNLAVGTKSRAAFLEMLESPVIQRIEGHGNLKYAWSVAFSPDGRWLASASGEDGGVRLYDSRTRRLLAALPKCIGRIVLFEPNGRSLLTGGAEGIIRWPLTVGNTGSENSVTFGEPQPVSSLRQVVFASLSRDGRWLACTAAPDEVWLLDLADPGHPIALGRHRSAIAIAISPDGQWVASGNWHGNEGVKVWQTSTRQMVKSIPMGTVTLSWSPDGRWLSVSGATGSNESQDQVLEAGSWTVRYASGIQESAGHSAFSPDSRTVAFISDGGRKIRLHEVGSFRQLATFEAPSSSHALWLSFSPDGNRLAAQEYRQGIQIWDLARLREELKTRGLD